LRRPTKSDSSDVATRPLLVPSLLVPSLLVPSLLAASLLAASLLAARRPADCKRYAG
jgi:hypothetical protein